MPLDLTLDDCGNRDRYLQLHGARVRHCAALGWYLWTGARWERDERGQVLHLAADVGEAIQATELAEAEEELEGARAGGRDAADHKCGPAGQARRAEVPVKRKSFNGEGLATSTRLHNSSRIR